MSPVEMSEALLVEFLDEELSVDTSEIEGSTLLFSSGLIDSFSLVTLITFLESRCEFTMNPLEVTLDYLDSIERILAYLEKVRS